jgi:formamidopyrimidine-DNA glycosylase
MRGTTDSDYRDSSGAPGGYQKVLKVYNREGEKCFGCDGMVKKNKIGQRGTFWCEQCQK